MELTEKQVKDIVKAAETTLGGARVQEYHEIFSDLAASAGTNTKNFSRVDSKRLRVITHMAVLNAVTACTFIKLQHIDGGQTGIDKVGVAPLIGETVNWDGFLILGESDYSQVLWLNCTINDDLYAIVSGYEIIK